LREEAVKLKTKVKILENELLRKDKTIEDLKKSKEDLKITTTKNSLKKIKLINFWYIE
jgi:hypothetical protein